MNDRAAVPRVEAEPGRVVPVALVLIFLLLFSTFRSVLQAGLVLANVPLALIGVTVVPLLLILFTH